MNTLPISEMFLSIQGEGKTIGIPSYFIRLQACNLMCGGMGTEKDGKLHNGAEWRCDTIEVWLKGSKMTYEKIITDLGREEFFQNIKRGYHIIFTGGEPLIHKQGVEDFIMYLHKTHKLDPFIEIETNGTITPSANLMALVDQWNVSPKLPNSGMPFARRYNEISLRFFRTDPQTIFKFVITKESDLIEMLDEYDLLFDYPQKIYLMPGADNDEDLRVRSQMVADMAIKNGFNFSSRLQVAIWNQLTGV